MRDKRASNEIFRLASQQIVPTKYQVKCWKCRDACPTSCKNMSLLTLPPVSKHVFHFHEGILSQVDWFYSRAGVNTGEVNELPWWGRWNCVCRSVSDAGWRAVSQCGINGLQLLVWRLTPASICTTTCCTADVTQRWKQIDLGNVCSDRPASSLQPTFQSDHINEQYLAP